MLCFGLVLVLMRGARAARHACRAAQAQVFKQATVDSSWRKFELYPLPAPPVPRSSMQPAPSRAAHDPRL
eukprot:scaffold23728_cov129-Isochrysis_galbana.AAC.4